MQLLLDTKLDMPRNTMEDIQSTKGPEEARNMSGKIPKLNLIWKRPCENIWSNKLLFNELEKPRIPKERDDNDQQT